MKICEFLKSYGIVFDKEPNESGAIFDIMNKSNAEKAWTLIQEHKNKLNSHFIFEYDEKRKIRVYYK